MYKINIVYYEGFANRDLKIKMAQAKGEKPFRPWSIHSVAELPIIPRPGDRVYFPLSERDAEYFPKSETEDGSHQIGGVVQWIEMTHGSDELYAVVTDEGHKGRGQYDGDYEADVKRALQTFVP